MLTRRLPNVLLLERNLYFGSLNSDETGIVPELRLPCQGLMDAMTLSTERACLEIPVWNLKRIVSWCSGLPSLIQLE